MDFENDLLWPHFASLWNDLKAQTSRTLLVAGGYGLFLKQSHCLDHRDMPTVVPLARWRNSAPRVTKDMDLVIDLELIADEDRNRETCQILRGHGFTESDDDGGKLWQWMKPLEQDRSIVVELHVPRPDSSDGRLVHEDFRVKRKQRLRGDRIHGHATPEAVGCSLSPFAFEAEGVMIEVPNPITWMIMKLTAMRDQWEEHEKATEEEKRRKFRDDAIKHGRDVCRIVALVTREEREGLPRVIDAISGTPEFQKAAAIQAEYFNGGRRSATDLVADDWSAEDFAIIREILNSWCQGNSFQIS